MYDDIILTSEVLLEDFVSQYGQFQVNTKMVLIHDI